MIIIVVMQNNLPYISLTLDKDKLSYSILSCTEERVGIINDTRAVV